MVESESSGSRARDREVEVGNAFPFDAYVDEVLDCKDISIQEERKRFSS